MGIWLRVGVSTWLAVVSVVDLRARRIPNALVLPVSYPRIVALRREPSAFSHQPSGAGLAANG